MKKYNTGNPIGSDDPRDFKDNSSVLDRAVNSSDATWTDRLGQVRPTLKQLETDYPLAGVHAEQADLSRIAAEQAKSSAEQSATDAAGKVTEAEAAKNQAALEADRAEAARDAAQLSAGVFSSVPSGIAATAPGDYFSVPSALNTEALILYWHRSGGTADEVTRYPSAQAVSAIQGRASLVMAMKGAVNINTATRKLDIGSVVQVNTGVAYNIVAQSVDIPSAQGIYWVTYDRETVTVALRANQELGSPDVVLGSIEVMQDGGINGHFKCVHSTDGRVSEYQRFGTLVSPQATRVNVNTVSGMLEVTNVRVIADSVSSLIASEAVPLPTASGTYRVDYDPTSNALSVATAIAPQSVRVVCVGFISTSQAGAVHELIGVPKWALNGEPQTGGAPAPVAPATRGQLVAQSPENINFDFASGALIVEPNVVRVLWGHETYALPGRTVSVDSLDGKHWHRLVFDPSGYRLTLERITSALGAGKIQVGLLHPDRKEIVDVPSYVVNGQLPPSTELDSIIDADFIVAAGDFSPDYDQPEIPDYSGARQSAAGDFTNIYALYDALQVAHPNYITSTVLGVDALGNEVKQWVFRSKIPRDLSVGAKRPKVVLVSGVHGSEQSGIWNIYMALREVCERWRQDKKLEALRWGVDFVVVPVATPSAFNLFTRKNHNGVDIARNFPSGWTFNPDTSASTYGGTSPLDQAEAVILDQLMSDHKDAVYFCSHHNFSGTPETQNFIWNASATEFGARLANRLVSIATIKAQARYGYLPQTDEFFIGYSDDAAPKGSEGYHAAVGYGLNAGTFEISMRWDYIEPRPAYGSEVATIGVEAFINWMLLNVRHGTQLKNSAVRIG